MKKPNYKIRAKKIFQSIIDQKLLEDRREYDTLDLMKAYTINLGTAAALGRLIYEDSQNTKPKCNEIHLTLEHERALVLNNMIQMWLNRAKYNPEILTSDLLQGMKEDVEALMLSDF